MLSLGESAGKQCGNATRREFLRVGGLGLAGLGLPALLQSRAHAAAPAARARSCIQLFMYGGPSQLDTFDPKPSAPEGIRRPFRSITTCVPGVRICEHLPRLAGMADRYAILRSMTHDGRAHGTSAYHMLTGHVHPVPDAIRPPAPSDMPSVGCAAARFGRQPRDLPAYVALPSVLHEHENIVPGQGAGILGQSCASFLVNGDPSRPEFSLECLELPGDVDGARLRDRAHLRELLDQPGKGAAISPTPGDMSRRHEQALGLLQSSAARRAFRLADEPNRVRDRYGWHPFGQSCLLARRLVEAGVPLVTVYWNAPNFDDPQHWDTHKDGFNRLRNHLLPPLDCGMSALFDDLAARGLLDETLVTWMGEFGRAPQINRAAGRDHWGLQSVVLAGAGVRGGQVLGKSDAYAAYPEELPVGPADLAATIFDSLGIRLNQEFRDVEGRPLQLCTGTPIRELS